MLIVVFLITLLLLKMPISLVDAKQDDKQRELVVVDGDGSTTLRPVGLTGSTYKVNNNNKNNKVTTRTSDDRAASTTAGGGAAGEQYSAEHKLYTHLLQTKYQKHVRPVKKHHKPITVKVGMCVMMIEDLIERDQVMIMAACVKMLWQDDFLAWNPEDYGNITWMAISSDKIWLPDIAIVNSPEPHFLTRKVTNVDLTFDGGVGYFPSGRLVTRCSIAISYFPFDRQNCEVRFESWIYPSQYLEIEMYPGPESVDIKEYYVNLHWTILGYRTLPEKVDYDGKNFSCITFIFSLRRKSAFYFMYFIFPELMLALLQTLSHTLPVEHPGRMTMLTALFIGSSVTHSGIAAHIPKSSDSMSLLQIYMAIVSINLVFALINSFVMLYTVLRYPNKEPSILAMLASFFSIIWPEVDEDKKDSCFRSRKKQRKEQAAKNKRKQSKAVTTSLKAEFENSPLITPDQLFASSSGGHLSSSELLNSINKVTGANHIYKPGCNQSGKHLAFPVGQASPDSPSLLPTNWLLDPKLHRVGCSCTNIGSGQVLASKEDRPQDLSLHSIIAKGSSPKPMTKSSNNNIARQAINEETKLTVETVHSTVNLEGEQAIVQLVKNIYARPPKPDRETLNRKRSSFGGGCSTQYMSKAYCIQHKDNPKVIMKDDEEEDENACALIFGPPGTTGGTHPSLIRTVGGVNAIENHQQKQKQHPVFIREDSGEIWRKLDGDNILLSAQNIDLTPSPSHQSLKAQQNLLQTATPVKQRSTEQQFKSSSSAKHAADSEQQESSIDFKHRWLVYCVALDKSVMYVNGVWNLIIPITLFAILPWLNESLGLDGLS